MSTSAKHYHADGVHHRQVQAALAMFQCYLSDGIESSWDDKFKCYSADIKVARWENCREQGYVLSLRSKSCRQQLNIAFFEHRNTDNMCAIQWEQTTTNSPTIDTMPDDVYTDKYDTTFDVPYGQAKELGEWLFNQFEEFWKKTVNVVDTVD